MALLDVINSNIDTWLDEIKNCSAKNHVGYNQQILYSYSPGKKVTVICSNCSHVYERKATLEEVRSHAVDRRRRLSLENLNA